MATFAQWLGQQVHREDGIGDLAHDLDPFLPRIETADLAAALVAVEGFLDDALPDIAQDVSCGPLRDAVAEYTQSCAVAAGAAAVAKVRAERARSERWSNLGPHR